jgi:hypothetical protein
MTILIIIILIIIITMIKEFSFIVIPRPAF